MASGKTLFYWSLWLFLLCYYAGSKMECYRKAGNGIHNADTKTRRILMSRSKTLKKTKYNKIQEKQQALCWAGLDGIAGNSSLKREKSEKEVIMETSKHMKSEILFWGSKGFHWIHNDMVRSGWISWTFKAVQVGEQVGDLDELQVSEVWRRRRKLVIEATLQLSLLTCYILDSEVVWFFHLVEVINKTKVICLSSADWLVLVISHQQRLPVLHDFYQNLFVLSSMQQYSYGLHICCTFTYCGECHLLHICRVWSCGCVYLLCNQFRPI